MNVKSTPDRLEAIQVLRAIAALLVVIVHAIDLYDLRTDLPRAWLQTAAQFNDFGASGVDLFFVLSGFVMAHAMQNPSANSAGTFIENRLLRVIPYYWLVSLVFLGLCTIAGVKLAFGQYVTSIAMFPFATPDLFLTPVLFVGWTLAFELAFYGSVAVAIRFAPSRDLRLEIALQLVCFFALTGFVLQPEADLLSILFNPIWFEFGLGIVAYKIWSRNQEPRATWLAAGLVITSLLALSGTIAFGFPFRVIHWGIINEGAGTWRALLWGLPYAAMVLGLLWLSASPLGSAIRGSRAWLLGMAIGDASYSLYLLHPFSIFAMHNFMPTNQLNADMMIALLVAVNAALAILAFHWIEKPMLVWLRAKTKSRPMVRSSLATS